MRTKMFDVDSPAHVKILSEREAAVKIFKITVITAIVGLVISTACCYFFGRLGIVPTIITIFIVAVELCALAATSLGASD